MPIEHLDNRIVLVDRPEIIRMQLRNDFPNYAFLPLVYSTVSVGEDITIRFENDPKNIFANIRSVDYIAKNGVQSKTFSKNKTIGVEKFLFDSDSQSSLSLYNFMNTNNRLNNILNYSDIKVDMTEEQLKSIKGALIIFDPSMINPASNQKDIMYSHNIKIPKDEGLRNKLVLGVYVNNTPFQRIKE